MIQDNLSLVKQDGMFLSNITLTDQTHEICYHAVLNNSKALSHVKDPFLKRILYNITLTPFVSQVTLEECITMCEKYYTSDEFHKRYVYIKDIIQTKKIISFAISQSKCAIQYINFKFLDSADLRHGNIKYVSLVDIYFDLVDKYPSIIKNIEDSLTDDICLNAVSINGKCLKYIKSNLHTKDILFAAAANNPVNVKYFKKNIPSIYLQLISADPIFIEHIPIEHKCNMYWIEAVKRDPTVLKLLVCPIINKSILTPKLIYDQYDKLCCYNIINHKFSKIITPNMSFEEFEDKIDSYYISKNPNINKIVKLINNNIVSSRLSKKWILENIGLCSSIIITDDIAKYYIENISSDNVKLITKTLCADSNSEHYAKILIEKYPKAINFIPDNLIRYDILTKAHIKCYRKYDPVVCKKIVFSNYKHIKYIPRHLQTEELCLFAVQRDINLFKKIKQYESTSMYVTSIDGMFLRYVLKQNLAICSNAIKNISDSIKYVDILIDTDIMRIFIKHNGLLIKDLDHGGNIDLLLEAVNENYLALQYIEEDFQYIEVIKKAIDKNYMAIQYVSQKNKTSDVCCYALDKSNMAFMYI